MNINLAIAERARAGEALTVAEIDELGSSDVLSLGMLADFILGVPFRPYAPIGFAQTGVAIFQFVRRVDVWYPMLLVPAPYPQSVVAPQ